MNTLKYQDEVLQKLSERDLLEQLAEECTELAQVALKLIRAKGLSDNVTPKTKEEVLANVKEEATDIAMIEHLLGITPTSTDVLENSKWKRWASRLENV